MFSSLYFRDAPISAGRNARKRSKRSWHWIAFWSLRQWGFLLEAEESGACRGQNGKSPATSLLRGFVLQAYQPPFRIGRPNTTLKTQVRFLAIEVSNASEMGAV